MSLRDGTGRVYLRNTIAFPSCSAANGVDYSCTLNSTVTPIDMLGHALPPGDRELCIDTTPFNSPPTGRYGDCVTYSVTAD